jgi:hypothetical protein
VKADRHWKRHWGGGGLRCPAVRDGLFIQGNAPPEYAVGTRKRQASNAPIRSSSAACSIWLQATI